MPEITEGPDPVGVMMLLFIFALILSVPPQIDRRIEKAVPCRPSAGFFQGCF